MRACVRVRLRSAAHIVRSPIPNSIQKTTHLWQPQPSHARTLLESIPFQTSVASFALRRKSNRHVTCVPALTAKHSSAPSKELTITISCVVLGGGGRQGRTSFGGNLVLHATKQSGPLRPISISILLCRGDDAQRCKPSSSKGTYLKQRHVFVCAEPACPCPLLAKLAIIAT